ncbi:hypothetical protein LCGC14_0477300, partial [marine sediment metagenome]
MVSPRIDPKTRGLIVSDLTPAIRGRLSALSTSVANHTATLAEQEELNFITSQVVRSILSSLWQSVDWENVDLSDIDWEEFIGYAVMQEHYSQNSILAANQSGRPEALTIAASRIVARLASGNIVAATTAEIKTLLAILATDVGVSELSSATYDNVQDYINFFGDRTLLSGGGITDNGNGTVAIDSLTGWCKETDSDTAVGKFF